MPSERPPSPAQANDEPASGSCVVRWGKQLVDLLGGREPLMLVVLLLVIAAIWGFIALAGAVVEGDTEEFDRWAVRSMRKADDPAEPIGPRWVQEMGRDATALGGLGWLLFFTLVVAGFLWLDGKRRMMLFVIAAVSGGTLVSFLLKQLVSRPRPDIVPHLSHVQSPSFPSGHSMLSAVVYLTLGALVAASLPRASLKIYVLSIAVLLTLMVGVSRVYMGVHYPTDVLAGWMAGLAWALGCWWFAHWLQLRGRVEPEDTPPPEKAQP
jgi:undecaprenyl-diphosphatase